MYLVRTDFLAKEDSLRQRQAKGSRLTYACSASGFSTWIVRTSRVRKSSLRSSNSGEFVYLGEDDHLSRMLPVLTYRNAV